MSDLLEVYLQTELTTNTTESLIVKEELPVTLQVIQDEVLLVDKPVLEILEIGIQGPPGIPGSGGSGGSGFETVLNVDYSNSVYSYIGTATKISRIDYSVSPPIVKQHSVVNYQTEWNNRVSLTYT